MSIGVSGIIHLNNGQLENKERTSFRVSRIAYENRVGCKMGGNVSQEVINNYKEEIGEQIIIFELLDTPLDNTADDLFCYQTYGGAGESMLSQRMSKVEKFLKEILEDDVISTITIDINYLEGIREEVIRVKVRDFAKKITSLYIEESIYVPVIRVKISKS